MFDFIHASAASDRTRSFRRNVWIFFALKFVWGLRWGTLLPIVLLFFLERGISITGFMLLMASLNLSSVAAELPTGLFADRFSRKWSIFVGALLGCGGVLVLIFAVDYSVMLVGFMAVGIGAAFASGADIALFYDSIKGAGWEGRSQPLLARALAIENVGMVSGMFVTGLIVSRTGLVGPFWGSAAALLTAAAITLAFVEPPEARAAPAPRQANTFREKSRDYFRRLKAAIQTVTHNPELLALAIVYVVMMRVHFLTERPFAGPYLVALGFSHSQLGFLFMFYYGVMSLFMLGSARVRALLWGSERSALLSLGILGAVALVVFVNAPLTPVVIVGMLGIYAMIGLLHPLMLQSLNRRLLSSQRASCLSLVHASNYSLGLLVGPALAAVSDNIDLDTGLQVFQWTFVPAILLAVLWAWRVLIPPARPGMPASSRGNG